MAGYSCNYFVLGLGLSGVSVASFLANKNRRVLLYDDNPSKIADAIATIRNNNVGPTVSDYSFLGNDIVVVGPGIDTWAGSRNCHPVVRSAREAGASIVSALDILKEVRPKTSRLIGITGSLGKSTVVTMVNHIMTSLGTDVAVGGNIGTPYFDIIPFDSENKILELSSYELENSKDPSTDIAVITNVFPHHLARHSTFERYIEAKLRVASSSSLLVLSADCDAVTSNLLIPKARDAFGDSFIENNLRFFSVDKIVPVGTSIVGETCYVDGVPTPLNIPHTMRHRHNLLNLACAIETSRTCCYMDWNKITKCLPRMKMLEHRNEPVGSIGKVHFINDSKSTMPASTAAAINSLSKNVMLIAGGKIDHCDSDLQNNLFLCGPDLMPVLHKVEKIFLIGEVAKYHMSLQGDSVGAILPEPRTPSAQGVTTVEPGHNSGTNAVVTSGPHIESVASVDATIAGDTPQSIGGGKNFSLRETLVDALKDAYSIARQRSLESGEDFFILFSPGCQSFDQFNNFMHRGDTFRSLVKDIMMQGE